MKECRAAATGMMKEGEKTGRSGNPQNDYGLNSLRGRRGVI
jgi:hypothetical protein